MKVSKFFLLSITLFVIVFVLSIRAHAALNLIGQGTSAYGTYNLIYDTDLDITWYDYTTDADSLSNLDFWVQTLSVTFGSNTYANWRMPATLVPDSSCLNYPNQGIGYDCTGSEMGHLFYTELGNVSDVPLSYTGDFDNLQALIYWSEEGNIANRYVFEFGNNYIGAGYQSSFTTTYSSGRAIAVMDGMAVVPEPISSTLFIVGGAALGFRRFRNKCKK